MNDTVSRPTASIDLHGAVPVLTNISVHTSSSSSGVETPSSSTVRTSRLTAAQTRLMTNPVDSLWATMGSMPISLSMETRKGNISSFVSPQVISSTILFSGGITR